MNILVTGVAGFIGFHTAKKLLIKGNKVVGIDNINNYYDKKIKLDRLKILKKYQAKILNFSKKIFLIIMMSRKYLRLIVSIM